jgi:hypothetical protein
MTLATDEFIRRLLIQHAAKRCFHRIRHYDLLAKGLVPTTAHARASCSPFQTPRASPPAHAAVVA